jgi:hypothetical protein
MQDSLGARLSQTEILIVLEYCLFGGENVGFDGDGWIEGLFGPACLEAADDANFRVDVESGQVVHDVLHRDPWKLLGVVMKVRGLTESDAEDSVQRKAEGLEESAGDYDDSDENSLRAPRSSNVECSSSLRHCLEIADGDSPWGDES